MTAHPDNVSHTGYMHADPPAQPRPDRHGWRSMESAPRDGTIIDVWLGDCDESDRQFYCPPGTRRSPDWIWKGDRFRPAAGAVIPTFVIPTHWRLPPPPPEDS